MNMAIRSTPSISRRRLAEWAEERVTATSLKARAGDRRPSVWGAAIRSGCAGGGGGGGGGHGALVEGQGVRPAPVGGGRCHPQRVHGDRGGRDDAFEQAVEPVLVGEESEGPAVHAKDRP